jgi:flagellar basal-body rod modification protein FlgD
MSSVTTPTPTAATTPTASTTPTPTSATAQATQDEQNFLKLFTSELKNQDPTSPTDISTYYQTINQYYSLEQQTTTNSYLATIANDLSNSATTTPTPSPTTTPTTAA